MNAPGIITRTMHINMKQLKNNFETCTWSCDRIVSPLWNSHCDSISMSCIMYKMIQGSSISGINACYIGQVLMWSVNIHFQNT